MTKEDNKDVLERARERFTRCIDWEKSARNNYESDLKFSYADSINNWQWDNDVRNARINDETGAKPCLTINKTQQLCLQIINDAKQNKPGVNIRPVGDGASYEAAQVFQNIVRHIEYISNAEQSYDRATETQVRAGVGYWRVMTDYISPKSFDQEIYIRPIKDPRSVYIDPNVKEVDASDSDFGFVFEDVYRDKFNEEYPKFKDKVSSKPALPGQSLNYEINWLDQDKIRIAEYYEKSQLKDTLVAFTDPVSGEQVIELFSKLTDEGKTIYKSLPDEEKQEREVLTDDITWYKIAGDQIVDSRKWPGKYIPIIRVIGTEIVINNIMDRFGHTRALLDPQRMYNIASSNSVEFSALQSKTPYIASAEAIEGYEEYWATANIKNHSFLPYKAIAEDGTVLPPPARQAPPTQSIAYLRGMEIAQNEMMMASGQYQSQLGENENAKSGIAIQQRQRQGDRATYHFIDNLAIAIRQTGKILIDLIPKIYDTQRALRCQATDGTIYEIEIDPESPVASKKLNEQIDKGIKTIQIAFNPKIGIYDIQSDVGPGYATRRQEAFNAMTQLSSQNKEFMQIAGDLYFRNADFPGSLELAERYAKIIPPSITGQAPPPEMQKVMDEAANQIQNLRAIVAQQAQELADKSKDQEIREYEAESKRLTAATNAPPEFSMAMIAPIVEQVIQQMLANPSPIKQEPEALSPDIMSGMMQQQPQEQIPAQ